MNRPEIESVLIGSLVRAGNQDDQQFINYTLPKIKDLINHPRYSKVFGVMNDFYLSGKPFDIVSLKDKIPDISTIEFITLSESQWISSPESAQYYIDQLTTADKIEKIQELAKQIIREKEIADPGAYISETIEKLMEIGIANKNIKIHVIQDVITDLQNYTEKIQSEGYKGGIKSGFPRLDHIYGGFEPGQLTIIAAATSVGKTSMSLNIADHMAINNRVPTLYISLEMMARSLARRIASATEGVNQKDIKYGKLDAEGWSKFTERCGHIYGGKLYIIDTPVKSIGELFGLIKMAILRFDIQVVFIDHLQLLSTGNKENGEYGELRQITKDIKNFSMANRVSTIALSQLSRNFSHRGGKPKLSDLRGSGTIEQDSDNVIFISREEEKEGVLLDEGYFIVAKQRDGESGEYIKVIFDKTQTRFYECEWIDRQQPDDSKSFVSRKTSKPHSKSPFKDD